MNFLRPTKIIAEITIKELLGKKILMLLVLLFCIFLMATNSFTYLAPSEEMKFVEDLGFTYVAFFLLLISLFASVDLVAGEIERKTARLILTKPVKRPSFLLGKISGLFFILLASFLIMSTLLLGLLYFKWHLFRFHLLGALSLTLIKYIIFSLIVIFLSLWVERLSVIFISLVIFFMSNSLSYLEEVSEHTENPVFLYLVKIMDFLLPHFENMNLADQIVLNIPLSLDYVLKTSLYGLFYTLVILILTFFSFRWKEI